MINNKNYCKIYLVRHAQSINNAKSDRGQEIFAKRLKFGSKLTPLGIKQAKSLAGKFKKIKFRAAYSSDYRRAYQTANILVDGRNLKVKRFKEIRERSWGSLEGKITGKIKLKIKRLQKGLTDEEKLKLRIVKDSETDYEAMERLKNFLGKIAKKNIGKTVLVVGHGNTMRALIVNLGYAKYDELPSGSLKNTGYLIIESNGENFKIQKMVGVSKKDL